MGRFSAISAYALEIAPRKEQTGHYIPFVAQNKGAHLVSLRRKEKTPITIPFAAQSGFSIPKSRLSIRQAWGYTHLPSTEYSFKIKS